MPRRPSIPAYRCHKQSGQAVVTLPTPTGQRRDVLLGPYGSPESRKEYARVIAEWEANGRFVPQPAPSAAPSSGNLTVAELLLRYFTWAQQHYGDAGSHDGELANLKRAARPLRELYAHTPAREFGPLALRTLQQHLVEAGLCRKQVNARINRLRRIFKWAVSYELLPPAVSEALRSVGGLQKGRSGAPDHEPVKPVAVEHVEATLPFLPDPVAAMVRLQLLTGCRAGEVMVMRAVDLDTSGPIWVYRPHSHKNRHRGLDRIIFLGPQAQAVVKPFLTTDLHAYLFSPKRYVEELRAKRAAARKTKRTPSELARKRKENPKRKPAERYDRRSYRQAVLRGVEKANAERSRADQERQPGLRLPPIPPWSPLQLRHTAATRLRAKYGLEAAKVILGHTRVETSQIYAEADQTKAQRIMGEVG